MRLNRIASIGALILGASVLVPIALSTPAGAVTTYTPPACTNFPPYPTPAGWTRTPAGCVLSVAQTAAGGCPTASPTPAQDTSRPVLESTAQINAWLASIPNNSIAQLAANRCYHTDGTVLVGAKTNYTLDGNNSKFKSFADSTMGRDNPHLQLQGNHSALVENLHIVGQATGGYDPTLEAQHGIYIVANLNTTVDNVTVDHVWGDYVSLENASNGTVPTNITVEDSQFGASSSGDNGAGRQEFTVDDGSTVNVWDNYFGHASRSAVDIEPTSTGATIQSIWFDGNTFGPNDLMWFSNHGVNATMTGIWFTNNTLNRAMNVDSIVPAANLPVLGTPGSFKRTDYQFIGNTSTVANGVADCTSPPTDQRQMRFIGVSSLYVDTNTQPMVVSRCQYLVRADTVLDATVTNNSLLNAASVGYYTNSTACEAGDFIGNPLHAAPISSGASPC